LSRWPLWLRVVRDALLVAAVLAALLGVGLAVSTARVEGLSMLPTLDDGDVLLVDRAAVRLVPPHRGDVVVVAEPNGVPVVKRVIAVPGDTVEIDGAHVDGPGMPARPAVLLKPDGLGSWQRLDELYVLPGWVLGQSCCLADGRGGSSGPRPLTLPAGEFFVLGDNRNVSRDSRAFGPVPGDRILARVLVRYWPEGRAGSLASGATMVPDASTPA